MSLSLPGYLGQKSNDDSSFEESKEDPPPKKKGKKKRKRKRKKKPLSFEQTKKLIVSNYTIRSSWLVQVSKLNMSFPQKNTNLYQECVSLDTCVKILQMCHPVLQGTLVKQKAVLEILSGNPLENLGDGNCIFVTASATSDGGNWVLPYVDKKSKSLVEPKSYVLMSNCPSDEHVLDYKKLYSNSVVGFMLNPTLFMSKEATQTEFVVEVGRDDRVIIEGELIRFKTPFTYENSSSVKLDGGQGGFFRMLLGTHKSKRYKGLSVLIGEHADYIKDQHNRFKQTK